MNMEEDNGRKVRRSSKRMGIKRSMETKRRIEGENRILQWFVEERGIRVQESGVDMEQDEGWNENRMGERGCGKE